MNIQDIRNLNPCYDPARYLPEDWEGTALDILKVKACPAEYRLWVVCHKGWIDDKTLRLFAVWCAREALKKIDNPDPRLITACDVAERYANGLATSEELDRARIAASDAAWTASRAAAWDASRDAASSIAWAAVHATARDAAWAASMAASGVSTSDSSWFAAWSSSRVAAQVKKLIEMLEVQS